MEQSGEGRKTPSIINNSEIGGSNIYKPNESRLGGKPEAGFLIPNVQGDKTIKCWSCETIMMVKEEWNVVQCPSCEKVCKIPEDKDSVQNKLKRLNLNGQLNHFDVDMPFVYAILICPYCRCDNKVRVNAEHMVCYKCHNSMNVKKEDGKITMTTKGYSGSSGASYHPGSNYKMTSQPPQKSLRFSDLFFPDPMFYPGYYSVEDSYSPLYPYFDPKMVDDHFRRRAKYESYKYHRNKESKITPVKQRLREINQNMGLGGSISTNNKEPNNVRTPVTGFENKIQQLKDKLDSNKKDKNHAIYLGIFGGKNQK